MLDKTTTSLSSLSSQHRGTTSSPKPANGLELGSLVRFGRRHWLKVLVLLTMSLAAAAYHLFNAPARFTSTATVLIDTRRLQVVPTQSVLGDVPVDAATVDSQVEVIRSEKIAETVIRQLRLVEDQDFWDPGPSILDLVKGAIDDFFATAQSEAFQSDEASKQFWQTRAGVGTLLYNLKVKRVGLTYVIGVSYTSKNPVRAAQIANAVAGAYINEQLDAKFRAANGASLWLQERVKELNQQARSAERALEDYKVKNNIVGLGQGTSLARDLSEQQLTELSSQLITARAQTAEIGARLERIQQAIKSSIPDVGAADVLKSDIISQLRNQYLSASKREAEIASQYGSAHSVASKLRNEMREYQRSIANEIQRITDVTKSEYEIAKSREAALATALDAAVEQRNVTNQGRSALADLESAAKTFRVLHDAFLQRQTETSEQASIPIAEARFVSEATPPLKKSSPRTLVILAGATLLGLGAGVALGYCQDVMAKGFRTPDDIRNVGMDYLGTLPRLRFPKAPGSSASTKGEITRDPSLRYVLNSPFTRFSETLRGIKVGIDVARQTRRIKTIGIVSALPKEGKTTISANLAQLMAASGHRVLLIDADLRNPSLTRALAPNAKEGLVEVVAAQTAFGEVLHRDAQSGLHLLPTSPNRKQSHSSEVLSSAPFESLLDALQGSYDYVVLDLPPLASVVDAKAVAHLVDAFVFVVQWAESSPQVVAEALGSAPVIVERLAGAVINNANEKELAKIEAYKGSTYQNYYVG